MDGWDIQFVRRVRWLWKYQNEPKSFPTYTLKLGDTLQLLDSSDVAAWLQSLDIPSETYERPLQDIPQSNLTKDGWVKELETHEIMDYLFPKLSNSNETIK